MGAKRREEYVTAGFDDFSQLVGDGFGQPIATGIRIPSFATTYLTLLALTDLAAGDTLVGIRQQVMLGFGFAQGQNPAPVYPVKLPITTPGWRLPDAGYTFGLTLESKGAPWRISGPSDTPSLRFRDSDSPALLYETVGGIPPGGTNYLASGEITSYTAPKMRGRTLAVFRDIHDSWGAEDFRSFAYTATRSMTVRLYASVTVSTQEARFVPNFNFAAAKQPFISAGMCPEDQFLQLFPGAQYWSVAGALIIDRGELGEVASTQTSEAP